MSFEKFFDSHKYNYIGKLKTISETDLTDCKNERSIFTHWKGFTGFLGVSETSKQGHIVQTIPCWAFKRCWSVSPDLYFKHIVSSRARGGGGGTCQNFDRDAHPIFLGLKFGQILFFWVGKFFSYISGFRKIFTIFLGLTNFQLFFGSSNFCITHLNPLNEEHTVLKNIK